MKWTRCSRSPAFPVQATSARGRRLRGLQAKLGGGGARDPDWGLRVCDSAPLGPWAPPELPAPHARQPRGPCAIPGERRKPARGRGGAGAEGAERTPRLRRQLRSPSIFGGAVGRGSAHGARDGAPSGRTDGRTPPHTQTHRARRGPRHAYTHTLAQTYTGTHAHSRARILPPACPPARRRPEPALAGVRERTTLLMTPREGPWTCAAARGCQVSPSR